MVCMKKIVITGGPRGGKTSILTELERRGFIGVPEAARAIIQEEQEKEKADARYTGMLPWNNLEVFQYVILGRQLKNEQEVAERFPNAKVMFLDRCVADGIGYLAEQEMDAPQALYEAVQSQNYTAVCLLEPLPYKQDAQRKETPEQAKRIHTYLCNTYEQLGFFTIHIPTFLNEKNPQEGIAKRVDYILEQLEGLATDVTREIEGKFDIPHNDVRQYLSQYHVTCVSQGEERNWTLYKDGGMVRLRENGEYIVTLKGPNTGGEVNNRWEHEQTIPEHVFTFLRGFYPETPTYTKTRETYAPIGDQSVTICLDIVDGLGEFVEIEAPTTQQVLLWKERLGIETDSISQSYVQLLGGKK